MKVNINQRIYDYFPPCLGQFIQAYFNGSIHFSLDERNLTFTTALIEPFICNGEEFRYKIKFGRESRLEEELRHPNTEDLLIINRIGSERPQIRLRRIGLKVFAEYTKPNQKKETRIFELTKSEAQGEEINSSLVQYLSKFRDEWRERYRH